MDDEAYLLQELEPLKDNHEEVYKVSADHACLASQPRLITRVVLCMQVQYRPSGMTWNI